MATAPPAIVTVIDRQASPAARKRPDEVMPSAISGRDGSETVRNLSARSSTAPSAPDAVRIGTRNVQTAAASPVCTATDSTSAVPAMWRAFSRSPRPSVRDTSATAPIIMPMATDITANWIVPAMPTAAIICSCPSRPIHHSARKSTRNVKVSPAVPDSAMTVTWRARLPVTNLAGAPFRAGSRVIAVSGRGLRRS